VIGVDQLARAYDLPLISYDRPSKSGLLISVGSGLMMASMDVATECAWCMDINVSMIPRLDRAMDAFKVICHPIIFVAWFSVTKPDAALVFKRNHPEVDCYFRGLGSDTGASWAEVLRRGC